MSPLSLVTVDGIPIDPPEGNGVGHGLAPSTNGVHHPPAAPPVPDAETLRRWAWVIGAERGADRFAPAGNHTALGVVTPYRGFAHWRIHPDWVEKLARAKGDAWHNCALVLRLYDVSYIEFTGLNAHAIIDI